MNFSTVGKEYSRCLYSSGIKAEGVVGVLKLGELKMCWSWTGVNRADKEIG